MKKNRLIIVRGASVRGHVTSVYLNISQDEAIRRFTEDCSFTSNTSSSTLEFDDEIQIEGNEPFLHFTVIN